MKKIFIIALAAGLATNMAMAQPQRPSKEEMQKNKCERIVKELALDNRTAQEFTEIYTKYQAEVNAINEKYPQPKMQLPDNRRPDRQGPDKKSKGKVKDAQAPAPQEKAIPTDAEIEKRIKDGFAREKALMNAKERYYNEFRKVLTPQQIQKMYTMENAPRHRGQMGGRPGGFQGTPGGFQGGHGQMGGMNPPDFF